MSTRTGLLPPATSVEAPRFDGLRLTIPALEALEADGNEVRPGDPDPWGRPRYRVELTGRVPQGLVVCLIGQGAEQHRGLRLGDEPEYPGEWPGGRGIAWHERGAWVPCPACCAPLVWYEAGYVPGYRVCTIAPHHHAQLVPDGRSAELAS